MVGRGWSRVYSVRRGLCANFATEMTSEWLWLGQLDCGNWKCGGVGRVEARWLFLFLAASLGVVPGGMK